MDQVRVTPEFKNDFDLVHQAFKTTPAEIEEAKQLARADLPAAIASYTETAVLIRRGWKPCGPFTP